MRHDRRATVLVVDDRLEMAETIAEGLDDRRFEVTALDSARAALARLEAGGVDALVTDLRMPELDGLALLAASRSLDPNRPVIVMTAYGAIDTAVQSIRQGAYHYVTKPFKVEELELFLGRALDERRLREEAAALRSTLRERFAPENIVGKSPALRAVLDIAERVAQSDVPVLIGGETGTGKGVIARVIHIASRRGSRRFVQVNCGALPETLLESELFGYVRGAFTGATSDRPGLVAEADGGTLFLDEVGEMSPALQMKLLHLLENRTLRPVGAQRERSVDVRIIAATHRDLRERVRSGAFREDLLYRLDVVPIEMPPLRQRREDIPYLVSHFVQAARERHSGSPVMRFSASALAALVSHSWPGNVRELQHVVERLVVLGRLEDVQLEDLPASVTAPEPSPMSFGATVIPLRELQRRYANWALEQLGGHRGHTSERLGIDPKTLAKWLGEGDGSSRRTGEG